MDDLPRLLTPGQVAKLLRISVKTVYARSKVPSWFWPFGLRALRFDRNHIDGHLERQGRESCAEDL